MAVTVKIWTGSLTLLGPCELYHHSNLSPLTRWTGWKRKPSSRLFVNGHCCAVSHTSTHSQFRRLEDCSSCCSCQPNQPQGFCSLFYLSKSEGIEPFTFTFKTSNLFCIQVIEIISCNISRILSFLSAYPLYLLDYQNVYIHNWLVICQISFIIARDSQAFSLMLSPCSVHHSSNVFTTFLLTLKQHGLKDYRVTQYLIYYH